MDSKTLLEIGLKKRQGLLNESWQQLAEQYGGDFFDSGESLRSWVKNQVYRKGAGDIQVDKSDDSETEESKEKFKEEVLIHKDGSQTSNKLIKMSLEDSKNPQFLLKAHGYSVDSWELISAQSSVWNVYSKIHGIQQLYSSKISVRPIKSGFSIERLIESFNIIKPINVSPNYIKVKEEKMLEIPLFDQHFGVSDFEYYKSSQDKIIDKLCERKWGEVLFVIGQDMIHNDDFRGRTSNGTQIEVVDMEKAWNDCRKFYETIIELSIKQSNKVKIMYAKGNHDESMSWAFVQFLKARFPNIEYDDSMIERKVHTFGDNFIGITHGDKGRKNLHNIFPIEFPEMWAKAKNREIHIGHLHVEDAKDVFGMVVRTLATRNKTDLWHKNNGFVGAHKRFMLFEYSKESLDSIHYV